MVNLSLMDCLILGGFHVREGSFTAESASIIDCWQDYERPGRRVGSCAWKERSVKGSCCFGAQHINARQGKKAIELLFTFSLHLSKAWV